MLTLNESLLRRASVEGLCKLFLASHVRSSELLSHLLLLLFTPTTEKDTLLRNILASFFPLFTKIGTSNRETLAKSFLPLFCDDFNEPFLAELSDYNLEEMIKYLIALTSPQVSKNNTKQICNTHASLAHDICTEILLNRNKRFTRVFASSLDNLVLTNADRDLLQEVSRLSLTVVKEVAGEVPKQYAEKFYQRVQNILQPTSEIAERSSSVLEETPAMGLQKRTELELRKIDQSPEINESTMQSRVGEDDIQPIPNQEMNKQSPVEEDDIQPSQNQENNKQLPEPTEEESDYIADTSEDEEESHKTNLLVRGAHRRVSNRLTIMKQNLITSEFNKSSKTKNSPSNSKSCKSKESIDDLENSPPPKKVLRSSLGLKRKREQHLFPDTSPPRRKKREILKEVAQDFSSDTSLRTSTPYSSASDSPSTNTSRLRHAKDVCNVKLGDMFDALPKSPPSRRWEYSKGLHRPNKRSFERKCQTTPKLENSQTHVERDLTPVNIPQASRTGKHVVQVLYPTAMIEFTDYY